MELSSYKALVTYSPKNCFKHSNKLKTIKDAISYGKVSLGDLRRSYGSEWLINYIMAWLFDLNDFLNVKNKMNDAQIEFCANEISNYSLKITDLTLFFKYIKSGKYGELYENISSDKILTWLNKYFDERCEVASNMNNNQIKLSEIHPEVAEAMFKNVGQEKIEHKSSENTLGKRVKRVITKDLIIEIKSKSTQELKDYIVANDIESSNYNETIYNLIEKELDERNKIN